MATEDRLEGLLELLAHTDPQTQRRIQDIVEGVEKLPAISAGKELLFGLEDGDAFTGNRGRAHFSATRIRITRPGGESVSLKLDVWGEPKDRSVIKVDFMVAFRSPPDVVAGDHDDLESNQDQLYWRLP